MNGWFVAFHNLIRNIIKLAGHYGYVFPLLPRCLIMHHRRRRRNPHIPQQHVPVVGASVVFYHAVQVVVAQVIPRHNSIWRGQAHYGQDGGPVVVAAIVFQLEIHAAVARPEGEDAADGFLGGVEAVVCIKAFRQKASEIGGQRIATRIKKVLAHLHPQVIAVPHSNVVRSPGWYAEGNG